jgi:VanW like protein
MHAPIEVSHREPTRREAFLFYLKTRCFILKRWWRDHRQPVQRHLKGLALKGGQPLGEARALLWTQIDPQEFPLTAGKVQNLRIAAARLDGVEVPAGAVLSFWKQLGRTLSDSGYTEGRELRSGCIVPNLGGGLCQLSGLLHAAALDAGLTVLERHRHSRLLPGSDLPDPQDATVFWNYVDLRFQADFPWRLECRLDATHLIVRIRGAGEVPKKSPATSEASGIPQRAHADGDCLTCGVTSCFRHPTAIRQHAAAEGHTAWLLEARWPEFESWCQLHAHEGDRFFTPLDGRRWKKPNYAWVLPDRAFHATARTLWNSFQQRKLPHQGAARQAFLLAAQEKLALAYARRIDPQARHLVISQTLLPFLWRDGHLGGRTFDVLLTRAPLEILHHQLDHAAQAHPASLTLADFRADSRLVEWEREALAAAARLITPHRALALYFGARAIRLEWHFPQVPRAQVLENPPVRWFFPASPLGRKGIYELEEAVRQVGGELCILGRATEDSTAPPMLRHARLVEAEMISQCTAVILPAWVEHEPRLALKALAMGISVIATSACGLPNHPQLIEIECGNSAALALAMQSLLSSCEVEGPGEVGSA